MVETLLCRDFSMCGRVCVDWRWLTAVDVVEQRESSVLGERRLLASKVGGKQLPPREK